MHNLTKWVDHNRFVFFGLLASLAVVFMASCEPTGKSPITGTPMTAVELDQQLEAIKQDLAVAQKKAESDYTAKVRAIQVESERALLAAQTEFEISSEQRVVDVEKLNNQFEIVQTQIAEKKATYGKAFEFVKTTLASVDPVLGGAAAAVLGILATGLKLDNRRKDRKLAEVKVT